MPRKLTVLDWSASLGLLVALTATPADGAVEPVHVVYDAAAGCPDRGTFIDEILARTRKASMASPSEAGRTFVVTIRAEESGFAGRLEIRTAAGAATSREVTGPICPAVTTALALITALAIDPDSRRAEGPSTPEPAPTMGPKAPRTRSEARWNWRVGALAEGQQSIAPSLALGGGAFAEIAEGEDGDGAPVASFGISAVRLGLHYARTGTIRRVGGAAHFDWAAAGLEGCVFRLRFGGGADAWVCAAFDLGALRGQGEEIALPEAPIRPWFSLGPTVRLQWLMHSSWFLDAEGSLIVPLRRDTFVFEGPTTPFHDVPGVGAGAGIGIGYQLGDRSPPSRP